MAGEGKQSRGEQHGRHTNRGVEVGVVQVVDNILDGRHRAVPVIAAGVSIDRADCPSITPVASYILKLPPTKNLRAMVAIGLEASILTEGK